jgi:hypothetical protein
MARSNVIENLPSPREQGDLEWEDSVTGKPKDELLQTMYSRSGGNGYDP